MCCSSCHSMARVGGGVGSPHRFDHVKWTPRSSSCTGLQASAPGGGLRHSSSPVQGGRPTPWRGCPLPVWSAMSHLLHAIVVPRNHVPCHITPGRGLHYRFGRALSLAQTKTLPLRFADGVHKKCSTCCCWHIPCPFVQCPAFWKLGMWVHAQLGGSGCGKRLPPSCACPDAQHAKVLRIPTTCGRGARLCARPCPHTRNSQHLASRLIVSHCFSLTRLTERPLVWAQQWWRPPASPAQPLIGSFKAPGFGGVTELGMRQH